MLKWCVSIDEEEWNGVSREKWLCDIHLHPEQKRREVNLECFWEEIVIMLDKTEWEESRWMKYMDEAKEEKRTRRMNEKGSEKSYWGKLKEG